MLVSFDNVCLRFGQDYEALSDVNLSISESSFHFLTGPSGAGKSTLLKLLYRVEKPTSGKIRLFGDDIARLSGDAAAKARRKIGVVFQDFKLIPHLTALENAALPLHLTGANERDVRTHVHDLLRWVGLADRVNAYPSELSGGEQQRVAIARAVVTNPKLLLADEPTGNVDNASAQKLMKLFFELNKMGTAILFATHQRDLVALYEKPTIKLDRGRVLA